MRDLMLFKFSPFFPRQFEPKTSHNFNEIIKKMSNRTVDSPFERAPASVMIESKSFVANVIRQVIKRTRCQHHVENGQLSLWQNSKIGSLGKTQMNSAAVPITPYRKSTYPLADEQ
jgi:hypothetical protein